jgi:type II secretion system protein G
MPTSQRQAVARHGKFLTPCRVLAVAVFVICTAAVTLEVSYYVASRGADAGRPRAARMQAMEFLKALRLYLTDMGRLPDQGAGLSALVLRPADSGDSAKWRGPYVRHVPYDPWGFPYNYRYQVVPDVRVWISSVGPDGVAGTSDDVVVESDVLHVPRQEQRTKSQADARAGVANRK